MRLIAKSIEMSHATFHCNIDLQLYNSILCESHFLGHSVEQTTSGSELMPLKEQQHPAMGRKARFAIPGITCAQLFGEHVSTATIDMT